MIIASLSCVNKTGQFRFVILEKATPSQRLIFCETKMTSLSLMMAEYTGGGGGGADSGAQIIC